MLLCAGVLLSVICCSVALLLRCCCAAVLPSVAGCVLHGAYYVLRLVCSSLRVGCWVGGTGVGGIGVG